MDNKPYRDARMYELGRGNRDRCVFDMSRISIDDYYGFFGGLPNVVYKKCKSITFNTDLDIKDRERDTTEEEQEIVKHSILGLKPRFSHYLMKILNQTLPKSKELNELILREIKIPTSYFSDFMASLARSRFLRVIELHGMTISDESASLMFQKLSPFKFTRIVATECNISSHLFAEVCDYLKQEIPEGKRWKLEYLDLSDNFFSESQMQTFRKLLRRRTHPDEASSSQEEDEQMSQKKKSAAGHIDGIANLSGSDGLDEVKGTDKDEEVQYEYEEEAVNEELMEEEEVLEEEEVDAEEEIIEEEEEEEEEVEEVANLTDSKEGEVKEKSDSGEEVEEEIEEEIEEEEEEETREIEEEEEEEVQEVEEEEEVLEDLLEEEEEEEEEVEVKKKRT